jgi:hypothetical protein
MDWPVILLVAILVVLLAFVIYLAVRGSGGISFWTEDSRPIAESPWDVYRHSDGEFDEAAREALGRATATANPTAGEHVLAATILRRNVLNGEARGGRTRAARVTPVNGARTPGRNAANAGQVGQDMAARLARERLALFNQTRQHYAAALDGLGRGEQLDAPGFGLGFVLDEIAGFAYGGLGELLGAMPDLGMLLFVENGGVLDEDLLFFHPDFFPEDGVDFPLAVATAQRREDLVRERQATAAQVAAAEGGARGAAVDTYVEMAAQHTDDPQNSHDPGALACLRAVLTRLQADQAGQKYPDPDAVAADIRSNGGLLSGGRPALLADALAVVNETKKGGSIMSLGGATDAECLGRVWLRADDRRNAAARGKIRQAVFDALVDCWETKSYGRMIACSTGRSTRFLSALVLLDFDERNWTVKKLEQFKNDIFELARGVIASEAEKASRSEDVDRRKAGELYLARTAAEVTALGDVPDSAVSDLENTFRDAINKAIDDYVSALSREMNGAEPIPPHMVESTRKEALAAII